MRIIQILPVLAFGDAIGNHTLALSDMLTKAGYQNRIYAEALDARIAGGKAEEIGKYKEKDGDIILYHMSTSSGLNRDILKYKGKKLLNYHNITPAHYFHGYLDSAEQGCRKAREDLAYLADKVDGCISDSVINQRELEELGYQCPLASAPILIAFDDYKKEPDGEIVRTLRDDFVNVLFVGRVVPNKKQEDVIEAFYYYQKYYNARSRLIIVGSSAGMNLYTEQLQWYADYLRIENCIFTGQISFRKILAYYHAADVFLCMSEHEGFCVPLVEAMNFRVPVIAYDSTAIPDTLGGGGILLPQKNPLETAAVIDYVMKHEALRNKIRGNQEEQLKRFEHKAVEQQYMAFLGKFI